MKFLVGIIAALVWIARACRLIRRKTAFIVTVLIVILVGVGVVLVPFVRDRSICAMSCILGE